MDSSSWPESLQINRIKAIQELTQGEKLTNKLREMLGQPRKIEPDIKSVDGVVEEILGMFDNTLSILSSSHFSEIPHDLTHDMKSPRSWDGQKSEDSGESVKTEIPIKIKRGCYKRRKTSSTFTKVTSNLIDDGYGWRKYGQKVILNSKHQRAYYRCTHKIEQGCKATKQVQKTDDEPPKYKITYNGHHTCKNSLKSSQIILNSSNPRDNSTLLNFETNTLIENKQVVGPCFPSTNQPNARFSSVSLIKYERITPNDGFSSLGLKQESDHNVACDIFLRQVPSEDMVYGLDNDHEDIVVSPEVFSSTGTTYGYEIDDMFRSNDFGEFPFDLCS